MGGGMGSAAAGYFLKGAVVVKTEFCPIVAGFCPGLAGFCHGVSGFLSRCGLIRREYMANACEMFWWKAGENRRRFRCCCVSGASDAVLAAPASRASQMRTNIRFGESGSRSVCSGGGAGGSVGRLFLIVYLSRDYPGGHADSSTVGQANSGIRR